MHTILLIGTLALIVLGTTYVPGTWLVRCIRQPLTKTERAILAVFLSLVATYVPLDILERMVRRLTLSNIGILIGIVNVLAFASFYALKRWRR